jgi:pyruvate dehydrogenase E1 component alpha subunit
MQDNKTIARLYKSMLLIRKIEQHVVDVYFTDAIKSPVHLSIGQESVAVGACDPLLPDDIVSNTYRCHATYIAKGGDIPAMMAELYGKKDGCAGGKAGSMHLVDMQHGILGASAVVGTTIPIAAGYAFALQQEAKKTGKQRIVVSLFGDGATEEGVFTETLNFAALKKLPIIFLCENNRLAIHTPLENRWASEHICERVASYGIRTHKVKDADIFALHDIITKEAANLRNGMPGPVFIECETYRWLEHVGPTDDHHENYRCQQELAEWKAKDQIARLAAMLTDSDKAQIHNEIDQIIKDAVAFAEQSPFPGIEELFAHVYAD